MIADLQVRHAARARALTLAVCTTPPRTRESTATYTDSTGTVQTAAVDEFRALHYVNGVLTPLYEPASTNLCVRSEEFDLWANGDIVTPNAIPAPDGATTADLLDNAAGVANTSVSNAVVFTADAEKCASVFLKAGTAANTHIGLRDNNVSAWRHLVVVTWTAGIPSVAIATGSGTIYPNEYHFASGMWRIAFSVAGVIAANANRLYIYPSGTGAVAGNVYAWGAQVENQAVPSSYIPTVAATGPRAADVGDSTLSATATGYARATGSFLTDGFRAGMEVTPSGFTQTARGTVDAVSALVLGIKGGRTAETSGIGRTLAVGMPASFIVENQAVTPVAEIPMAFEEYLPGGRAKVTVGAFGEVEGTPLYLLRFTGKLDVGPEALAAYGDAVVNHFPPSLPLTCANGDIARVRGDVAPTVGQALRVNDRSSLTVTIPLRIRSFSSR